PGNRVTTTDADGNAPLTHNDGLGPPTSITDPYGQKVLLTYDGVNRLTQTDKKGHLTVYHYDALNRLILTEEFDGAAAGPKTSLAVDYQDAHNRVTDTDRRGTKTVRQMDSLGRTVRTSRVHPDLAQTYGTAEVVLEEDSYDGNNNKVLVRDAGGNLTKFVYDGANRLTGMVEGLGSPVEATTHYTYDDAGNVLTVKDGRPT